MTAPKCETCRWWKPGASREYQGLCGYPLPMWILQAIRSAEFTVTIGAPKVGVVVTDAAVLADEFMRITRTPDKAAIAKALADGVVVDGAEMQNGMPTMTVHTK